MSETSTFYPYLDADLRDCRDHDLDAKNLAWELIFVPLLYGPITIQDSVALTNWQFIQLMADDDFAAIMALYARKGLIKVRTRKIDGVVFDSILDTIISYTDQEPGAQTHGIGTGWMPAGREEHLDGEERQRFNDDLKDVLTRCHSIDDHRRRFEIYFAFFERKGFPAFEAGVKNFARSFENSGTSDVLITWRHFPTPIQTRLLQALGVCEIDGFRAAFEARDWRKPGDLLKRQIQAGNYRPRAGVLGFDFLADTLSLDLDSDFVRALVVPAADVGKGTLVGDAEKCLTGTQGDAVKLLIDTGYVCGYAENNATPVVWAWPGRLHQQIDRIDFDLLREEMERDDGAHLVEMARSHVIAVGIRPGGFREEYEDQLCERYIDALVTYKPSVVAEATAGAITESLVDVALESLGACFGGYPTMLLAGALLEVGDHSFIQGRIEKLLKRSGHSIGRVLHRTFSGVRPDFYKAAGFEVRFDVRR